MLRFNKDQIWMPSDLETEGLQLFGSRPWQCSWILVQGNKVKVKHNRFIYWPDLNITKGAAIVTGFNIDYYLKEGKRNKTYKINNKIFNAEDPKKVLDDYENDLFNENYKILGHNFLGYDTCIIGVWQKMVRGKVNYSFVPRIYDSHLFAKAIKLDIKPKKEEDLLAFQYRISNIKKRGLKTNLSFLANEYKIPFDSSKMHDGSYDIDINYKLWARKMLFELEI